VGEAVVIHGEGLAAHDAELVALEEAGRLARRRDFALPGRWHLGARGFDLAPGFAANGADGDGLRQHLVLLREADGPVLAAAVGAYQFGVDGELAGLDRRQEVQREGQRRAAPFGMVEHGLHHGAGRDAAEGTDHVPVVFAGAAAPAVGRLVRQRDGGVEGMRVHILRALPLQ
jgi:hypothetical protein